MSWLSTYAPMNTHKFLLLRLRPDVEPAQFERWHREVNVPFAIGEESIRRVTLARLANDGALAKWDYVEDVVVADDKAYGALQVSDRMAELFAQFATYIAETSLTEGREISPDSTIAEAR
jgi:hypothetical protein